MNDLGIYEVTGTHKINNNTITELLTAGSEEMAKCRFLIRQPATTNKICDPYNITVTLRGYINFNEYLNLLKLNKPIDLNKYIKESIHA